jgi:hypothetical protein
MFNLILMDSCQVVGYLDIFRVCINLVGEMGE